MCVPFVVAVAVPVCCVASVAVVFLSGGVHRWRWCSCVVVFLCGGVPVWWCSSVAVAVVRRCSCVASVQIVQIFENKPIKEK